MTITIIESNVLLYKENAQTLNVPFHLNTNTELHLSNFALLQDHLLGKCSWLQTMPTSNLVEEAQKGRRKDLRCTTVVARSCISHAHLLRLSSHTATCNTVLRCGLWSPTWCEFELEHYQL
jgi:hypothetical protein